jgi:hypothetical protein
MIARFNQHILCCQDHRPVLITTLLTLLGHSLFTIMPLWRQGDAYALCEF